MMVTHPARAASGLSSPLRDCPVLPHQYAVKIPVTLLPRVLLLATSSRASTSDS
jgi:hypothetical protein